MAFGVSRRTWLRPLILGRLSSRAGSNRVAGSWSQIIDWWTPARSAGGSGRCFEGNLANLSKGVVAAARELASDGDESDVGVEPLTKPLVVGIVG